MDDNNFLKKIIFIIIISGIACHVLLVLIWLQKTEAIYYLPPKRKLHQVNYQTVVLTLVLELWGRLSVGSVLLVGMCLNVTERMGCLAVKVSRLVEQHGDAQHKEVF